MKTNASNQLPVNRLYKVASLSILVLLSLLMNGCISSSSRTGYHTRHLVGNVSVPRRYAAVKPGINYQRSSQIAAPHILPDHDTATTRVVRQPARPKPPPQVTLPPLPPLPKKPVLKRPTITGSNPFSTIQNANRDARRSPNPAGYNNALMTYTFEEGALYDIFAAPLQLTSIQLQPGEVITGKPAAGDTVRWIVGVNQGQKGSSPHILIKPVQAGLKTSMVVNTNKRTYLLNLSSYPKTWMPAVRWNYPVDDYQRQLAAYEAAKAKREAAIQRQQQQRQHRWQQQQEQQRLQAKAVDVNNLNFAYAIEAPRFGRPAWTPLQVFDDGRKTFIRFPKARRRTEAPALFVVNGAGELQLVNYRVQNDVYVVDRLFDRAELRVGQKRPRIVRIQRRG